MKIKKDFTVLQSNYTIIFFSFVIKNIYNIYIYKYYSKVYLTVFNLQ